MTFKKTVGSRAEVWHGTAKHTSGGLEKKNLMKNHLGRIVSKAKHISAKKEMRLVKHGYGSKKGHFGVVKMASKSRKHKSKRGRSRKGSRKGSRKMRGGMTSLHPADADSSYMLSGVVPQAMDPLDRALVGGKRRKRSRKMRGGMTSLNPADADSSYMLKDVSPQPMDPTDRALVGGRKRKGSRSRGRK